MDVRNLFHGQQKCFGGQWIQLEAGGDRSAVAAGRHIDTAGQETHGGRQTAAEDKRHTAGDTRRPRTRDTRRGGDTAGDTVTNRGHWRH